MTCIWPFQAELNNDFLFYRILQYRRKSEYLFSSTQAAVLRYILLFITMTGLRQTATLQCAWPDFRKSQSESLLLRKQQTKSFTTSRSGLFSLIFISYRSYNCIAKRCLINVVYLTACALNIRSWWRCTFWMTWHWMETKIDSYVIIASLNSESAWKLINRTPGFTSFDIKLTRLNLIENASWIARQASRCQQAFSKPCLVNLISKDTHLVLSIWASSRENLSWGFPWKRDSI